MNARSPRAGNGVKKLWGRRQDVSVGSKGEILAKSRCFPLCPQEGTSLKRVGMSVRCQGATLSPRKPVRLARTYSWQKADQDQRGSRISSPKIQMLALDLDYSIPKIILAGFRGLIDI